MPFYMDVVMNFSWWGIYTLSREENSICINIQEVLKESKFTYLLYSKPVINTFRRPGGAAVCSFRPVFRNGRLTIKWRNYGLCNHETAS
jgi:hypothetical protein